MIAYKLTDQNCETRNRTKWGGNGVTHEITDPKPEKELTSNNWLHYYDNPLLAVFFNPIHSNIKNPILWESKAEGLIKSDNGTQFGCTKLTTIKIIPLPQISLTQIIAFAILCAKKVTFSKEWNNWADNWLSNTDRTKESAIKVIYAHTVAMAAAEAVAYNTDAAITSAIYVSATGCININFNDIAKEAMKY